MNKNIGKSTGIIFSGKYSQKTFDHAKQCAKKEQNQLVIWLVIKSITAKLQGTNHRIIRRLILKQKNHVNTNKIMYICTKKIIYIYIYIYLYIYIDIYRYRYIDRERKLLRQQIINFPGLMWWYNNGISKNGKSVT